MHASSLLPLMLAADLMAPFRAMPVAVNNGDASAYANLYSPEATLTIYGGVILKGRAKIEEYERELLRQNPGTRLAFYDVWQTGRRAGVHYGVNTPTALGTVGHEGLLFYVLNDDGTIKEEHRYLDSITPMAQQGLLGAVQRRPAPSLASETHFHQEPAADTASAATALIEPAPVKTLTEMALTTAAYETWRTSAADAHCEITNTIVVGDTILAELIVRGTLTGSFGSIRANHTRFEAHRAVIAKVRAGRIVEMRAFMNGKELAQSLGQWPLPSFTAPSAVKPKD